MANAAQGGPTVTLDAPVMLLRSAKGQFAMIAPDGSPVTVTIPFIPGAPRWFVRFKSP